MPPSAQGAGRRGRSRPGAGRRLRRAVALALAVLPLASGCRRSAAPAAPPPGARHLVLVTLDTLRADRLGVYGSTTVATPRLDRIAREGAFALRAVAHAPLTRPSHASLLTGRLPTEHGIRDNVSAPLDASLETLAERLAAHGFRTAGFVSSVVLSAQSGLNRGFATFSDRFEGGDDDARFLNTVQTRGDVRLGEAVAWLESNAGAARAPGSARLFAWLHLYDPHDPYEPPEPYASRYAGRPYDGEVAWTDELVGRLDTALARLGLAADTLLVVTSDHGEGLGDHGESLHGFFVYEPTLAVPLLLRGPGIVPGGRLPVTTGSVDLFPTLLELLGLPLDPAPRLSGRSLASPLRGGPAPPEAPVYAESLVPLLHFGWSDLRVLREGRFKYIQAPRPELYDLERDPGERHDLARRETARAEAFRAALARLLAEERAAAPAAESVPPELLEKLGALGYLGAGGAAPGPDAGADPKDKLEEFKLANRLMREALEALHAGRPRDTVAHLDALHARGIRSFEVHYYRAKALGRLERHAEAAAAYRAATRLLPRYLAAWQGLAESLAAAGDSSGALAAVAEGLEALPGSATLRLQEARLRLARGERDLAIAAYEAARPLAPKDALLRVRLGELYRDAGASEAAVAALREALALDPGPASYWNALGLVLAAAGRMHEAADAFAEAAERDAREPQYAYNVGLALLRLGRRDEAARQFRRVLALEPGFRAARERLTELGVSPS